MTRIWTKTIEVERCSQCPNRVGNCAKDYCVPLQEFCTVLPLPKCPLPEVYRGPTCRCGHPENLEAFRRIATNHKDGMQQ